MPAPPQALGNLSPKCGGALPPPLPQQRTLTLGRRHLSHLEPQQPQSGEAAQSQAPGTTAEKGTLTCGLGTETLKADA